MYGFVNSALEKLIKRRFGVEKWDEIRLFANVKIGEAESFHVNHVYNDSDTYTVVSAASEILGLDAATILEMFGEQFLLSCQESGYSKTLRLLGRSLQDFLTNLDALHDHLSIIYPQMDAPSFRCTKGNKESEFLLHYYSDRAGLENIVMGIVKSVAREYYNTEVEMKLLIQKGHESDHSIFSIREIAYYSQTVAVGRKETDVLRKSASESQLISSETFCKAFPFHIIFDANLRILQVGSSLSWVLPNLKLKESQLHQYFALERPRMKLSFENFLSHINTIFVLRMIHTFTPASDGGIDSDRLSMSMSSDKDPMRLRGQMIFALESEAMLFLCSPRVKRLNDLEQRGLYLSDIPIHDATRGMLMMGQAAAAEFTKSVRLEELIIELNSTQKSLEEEKRRMSDLLHQMLPISVADSLMAGQMVEAERFESVTVLFSDIVGFTSICGNSEPMQIVNMLNKLYSMFDQVVGQNQVYKVETIGDAYMVVGGLPEKNDIHAECVANQALDMMHYCKQVKRPDNNQPITMRIGIHSGPVVAGIVGRRMPRYCLFGNTVNVASRTESNGTPGKIQVTEYTYKLLVRNSDFKFEFRDRLNFKNVPDLVSCYYLLENTSKTEFPPMLLSDEPEHVTYKFIMTKTPVDTPPASPAMNQLPKSPSLMGMAEMLSFSSDTPPKCPFQPGLLDDSIVPDVRVIRPTPGHTPNPTPPTSKRSSLSEIENQHWFTCSDQESDSDTGLHMRSVTPPTGRSLSPRASLGQELDLQVQSTTPFMDTMRKVSMSPLREDEETRPEDDENNNFILDPPYDEGIVMRKLSDVSVNSQDHEATGADLDLCKSQRKVSDVSTHSIESGIESTKMSDSAKDENNLAAPHKSSVSSNGSVEEELSELRRSRAGSVRGKIEQYNTLERQRRSGLSTTAYANASGNDLDFSLNSSPTYDYSTSPTSRPTRKSFDSLGSSSSNE